MKKIVSLIALMIMGAFAEAQNNDGKAIRLVIGTYGGHLYGYSFDTGTAVFTEEGRVEALNPSYAIAEDGNIFAVSETGADSGVYSFIGMQSDGDGGIMTFHLRQTGADPCYIMLHRTDAGRQYVMTADYSGGSVSVFPVIDGRVKDRIGQMHFEGKGPVAGRQEASHIHQIKEVPHHKGYILASDLGADLIRLIKVQEGQDGPAMEHIYDVHCPSGSGPRHLEFSHEGNILYCITELSGEVLKYDVTSEGGVPGFRLSQRIQADEVNAGGSADIHIHPSGKWLYTSHRLDNDGIAIFSIKEDGTLVKTGYARCASHPRNFLITPDGKFLLVACLNDRLIQTFRIGNDGSLTLTPSILCFESDRPSSITIASYLK